MADRTSQREADKRLLLLIGLLGVSALVAVVASVSAVTRQDSEIGLALLVLIGVSLGSRTAIEIRIRSTEMSLTSTSVAILFGSLTLSVPLLIVVTAAGIGAIKLINRQPARKWTFNTAHETLAAGAAGWVANLAGARPGMDSLTSAIVPLLLAGVTYAGVELLLAVPVLSLATGANMGQQIARVWEFELFGLIAKLACVYVAFVLYHTNQALLLAVPLAMYLLRLAFSARIRERTEREAWRELAAATDEFSRVDVDAVLTTAVDCASRLFSADEVEIQLHGDPAVRVRHANKVAARSTNRPQKGSVVTVPIVGGPTEVGLLRLIFDRPVDLTERENYTLETFVSALSTAVRNARAHAKTQELAKVHEYAATHDPLTGLGNRRYLVENGQSMLTSRPGGGVRALLLLDVNHFKELNDALGHDTADDVLKGIAHRLTVAGGSDVPLMRLGGDEFAAFLTGGATPALMMAKARDLLSALDPALEVNGLRIGVEASAGIALADNGTDVTELLRRADVALHQAKRSNTRLVAYTAKRDTADLDKLALGADLPRAVAEHEFVVEFQPIVDMGSGMVIGTEALTRWRHPDRGELDPRGFMDAIERSALLPAFAEGILDQALAASTEWTQAGFSMPIAVNVSPRSLLDPGFLNMVSERLTAHGIAANQLMLEVTESLALSHLSVVDEVLGGLQKLGVLIALDDFGTGFSSLATLARVPVDEIKIDRSFVVTMDKPASAAVVRSTIELGRSLDLLVVAEGVEQEDQRRALWELGCPAGQGHLFARPMPADRVLATLQRGFEGRPGALAEPINTGAAVIRMSSLRRRGSGEDRRRAT